MVNNWQETNQHTITTVVKQPCFKVKATTNKYSVVFQLIKLTTSDATKIDHTPVNSKRTPFKKLLMNETALEIILNKLRYVFFNRLKWPINIVKHFETKDKSLVSYQRLFQNHFTNLETSFFLSHFKSIEKNMKNQQKNMFQAFRPVPGTVATSPRPPKPWPRKRARRAWPRSQGLPEKCLAHGDITRYC